MGMLSQPITKLVARLAAHTAVGKILAGWKFEAVPANSVDGMKDLPGIRLYIPAVDETARGGNVSAVLTVNLLVSTARTVDPNAIAEHMVGVEKVLDALDTHETTGAVDPGLGGSLRNPLVAKTTAQYVLDLSVNTELTLTLGTRAAVRGSRR